jgi:hypothetical protein
LIMCACDSAAGPGVVPGRCLYSGPIFRTEWLCPKCYDANRFLIEVILQK